MHDDATRDLLTGAGFGKGYDYPPSRAEQAQARLGAAGKAGVQRVLRAALGTLGLADAARLALAPRPPLGPATFHPRRILVIRVDMLGDVVLTLPAVAALRRAYPDAPIDFLALPATAGILAGHPDIAAVLTADPNAWLARAGDAATRDAVRATVERLRAARYDLAVSVCGDWASILARLSGAGRRVGFAAEAFPHFLTDTIPGGRYQTHQHETDYVAAVAERAGGSVDPPGSPSRRPRLPVPDAARRQVAALLAAQGLAPDRPVIALHAGARNGQAKRWPLPSWARLADDLAAQTRAAVVLVGAPGDHPLAQAVLRRMADPQQATDLTGMTDLPQLAALLERCAVVVTGDSGPLHIAEAVGTRVVALHGPTDPAQSGPCGPDAVVLWRHIWCAPCYNSRATAECRFHHPICMLGLPPGDVLAATVRQLAASRDRLAHRDDQFAPTSNRPDTNDAIPGSR